MFRSAVAVHNDPEQLELLGNYLRTLALQCDPTYRDVILLGKIFAGLWIRIRIHYPSRIREGKI